MKKPFSFLLISILIHGLILSLTFKNMKEELPMQKKEQTRIVIKYEKNESIKQVKSSPITKKEQSNSKMTKSKTYQLKDLGFLANESLDYIKPKISEFFEEKSVDFEKSLNKDEDKFYSYLQRIKIKLDNVWQTRVRDVVVSLLEENKLSFGENKITYLLITLDKNGSLVNVQHISSSGLVDLDQTAVNAFRLAEPFPNPPKDLIESDGFVRVKWKFIVIL